MLAINDNYEICFRLITSCSQLWIDCSIALTQKAEGVVRKGKGDIHKTEETF